MRTRKLPPPNLCAWCDDPSGSDVLCPVCRAAHDHPLFYCPVDPTHLPTSGPSCATCDIEAARRARVARENAPLVAQLQRIRASLVAEWGRPWPGCEFGKALVGMGIDGALKSLGASPDALP